MTRTELTGYMLTATAIALTALICVQASRLIDTRAHAEMAVHKDTITMISTTYLGDNELIYLLDSRQQVLLAYLFDPNKRTINPVRGGVLNIGTAFEQLVGGGAGGATGPASGGRYRQPR